MNFLGKILRVTGNSNIAHKHYRVTKVGDGEIVQVQSLEPNDPKVGVGCWQNKNTIKFMGWREFYKFEIVK